MDVSDFFEADFKYLSSTGTFDCKYVLDEHGKRYAFGSWYSSIVDVGGPPVVRTYRESDYSLFKLVPNGE